MCCILWIVLYCSLVVYLVDLWILCIVWRGIDRIPCTVHQGTVTIALCALYNVCIV